MKKSLAKFLAFFILFVNMGFTLATHYCGGHAVENKLVMGKVSLECGMEKNTTSCQSPRVHEASCCENTYLLIGTDENVNFQIQFSVSVHPVFLFAFTCVHFNFSSLVGDIFGNLLREISPPSVRKPNLQILYQTFLI